MINNVKLSFSNYEYLADFIEQQTQNYHLLEDCFIRNNQQIDSITVKKKIDFDSLNDRDFLSEDNLLYSGDNKQ
jgi:hypothetical protein